MIAAGGIVDGIGMAVVLLQGQKVYKWVLDLFHQPKVLYMIILKTLFSLPLNDTLLLNKNQTSYSN